MSMPLKSALCQWMDCFEAGFVTLDGWHRNRGPDQRAAIATATRIPVIPR
ncbi:MAG: hypothetical protein JSS57_09225 [Proteobacteria bacterium]|nr:hypothetical protein [Pseudomonadota bacterium]